MFISDATSDGTRRVGRWNLRDSAEGESDFEDNVPTKRKKRSVSTVDLLNPLIILYQSIS